MSRLVVALCLILFSVQPSHSQANKPRPKTVKRVMSVAELHDVARSVTVGIDELTQQGEVRHLGSGVWLTEEIVATCWLVA